MTAHAGLYRQLQDLSAQVTEVGEEVKRTRALVERRVEALELQVVAVGRWVKVGVGLLVVLAGAVIFLLTRLR